MPAANRSPSLSRSSNLSCWKPGIDTWKTAIAIVRFTLVSMQASGAWTMTYAACSPSCGYSTRAFLPEVAVAVLGSQPLFDSYEFRGTLMDIGAPIDLAEEAPNQYTPIYNKMNTDWDFGENTAIYAQLDTLWQRGLLERNVYTIGDQREASRALLYRLLPTIRSYLKTTFAPEGAESQPLLARLGEAYAVLIRELAAEISSNPLKVTIVEQSLEDLERGLTYATGKAKLDYLSDLSGILGRFGYRQKSLDLASEARKLAEILEPAPQNPRRPRSVPEEVENQLQAMETDALALFDAGQPEKALTVLQQVLSLSRKYDQRSNEAKTLSTISGTPIRRLDSHKKL